MSKSEGQAAEEIPDFSEADFASDRVYQYILAKFEEHQDVYTEYKLGEQFAKSAKRFHISSSSFKTGYKLYKKSHLKEPAAVVIGNKTYFKNPNGKSGLFCGPYEADDNGIRIPNSLGQSERVSFQPICPVARIEDVEDGRVFIELWDLVNGKDRTFTFGLNQLMDSQKLLKLSEFGIDVSRANANQLSSYLRHIIMDPQNNGLLPAKKGISHCGFVKENLSEFVPFTGDYVCTGIDGNDELFECLKNPRGRKERQFEFFDHVRKRKDFSPIVRIAIAASFASVLLHPLERMGFFVHLWGRENTAKSAAVWLAASIWADPRKVAPYVKSFDGTMPGSEGRAYFLQSIPVCLDETTVENSQEKFDRFVYKMCQGMDKTRGTKDGGFRKHKSWACAFISSGEKPIQGSTSNGGSMVRVLSLSTRGKPLFGEFYETIYKEVSKHAGWIGRKFIEQVLRPERIKEAKELMKQFLGELKEAGYAGKQADAAAICLVADTLASQYVFEDEDDSLRLTIDDFRPHLVTPEESDAGMRTAQWLKGFIAANMCHFIQPGERIAFDKVVWGKCMANGYIAFNRAILEREMVEAGQNLGIVRLAEWAEEKGIILRNKNDKSLFKSENVQGGTIRCLVINIEAIDPAPTEEEVEEADDSEFPFSIEEGEGGEYDQSNEAAQIETSNLPNSEKQTLCLNLNECEHPWSSQGCSA